MRANIDKAKLKEGIEVGREVLGLVELGLWQNKEYKSAEKHIIEHLEKRIEGLSTLIQAAQALIDDKTEREI